MTAKKKTATAEKPLKNPLATIKVGDILMVPEDNMRSVNVTGGGGNEYGEGRRMSIADLKKSINDSGFTSVLIVREHTEDEKGEFDCGYRLCAGFHRFTALTMSGKGNPLVKPMLDKVPCVVLPASASRADILRAAIGENVERVALTPADKAVGIAALMAEGLLQKAAGKVNGASPGYTSNLVTIFKGAKGTVWADFANGDATVRQVVDSKICGVAPGELQDAKWEHVKKALAAGIKAKDCLDWTDPDTVDPDAPVVPVDPSDDPNVVTPKRPNKASVGAVIMYCRETLAASEREGSEDISDSDETHLRSVLTALLWMTAQDGVKVCLEDAHNTAMVEALKAPKPAPKGPELDPKAKA